MKRMCKKLSALFALCAVAMAVFGFAVPGAQADVTATDVENLHLQKLTHAPQNHFAADQRFYFTFTPASDEYGTGATTADTPAAGNIVGAQDDNLIATVDSTTAKLAISNERTGQSGLVMQVGEDYSRENLDGKVFLPIASEFPHAGVYAYVVTENANVDGQVIDAVTYSQAQYIMRVYVTNTQIDKAKAGGTTTDAFPTVTLERIKTDDGQTTLADEQIGKSTDNTTNNLSDKVGKVNPTTLTNVIRSASEEDATHAIKFKNTSPGDGTGSANEDYQVDANTTYSACPPEIFKKNYAKGFEFYNDYNKSANTKLTFTKLVDGEYGDKTTQYFTFEMDIRLAEEHIDLSNDYVEKHSGTNRLDYYETIENAFTSAFTNTLKLSDGDYTLAWQLFDSEGNEKRAPSGYAQLDAKKSDSLILHVTFKAKHDDTFTIANVIPESSGYSVKETGLDNLPYTPSAVYSQVVTSTEDKASETGVEKSGPVNGLYTYTTKQTAEAYKDGSATYEVKNWDSSTSALPTKVFNQSSITITNTYKENAVTPTGIFVANAPYLILVGVPVVGLVVWFVRRRQNAHRA